jgi:hypothetical protein
MGKNGNEDDIEKRLKELKMLEHDLDYDLDDLTKGNKRAAAPVS